MDLGRGCGVGQSRVGYLRVLLRRRTRLFGTKVFCAVCRSRNVGSTGRQGKVSALYSVSLIAEACQCSSASGSHCLHSGCPLFHCATMGDTRYICRFRKE